MTAHAPDDLQLAFLRWIDRGLQLDPEASKWPLETRGLKYVVARAWREHVVCELWNSTDTMPDAYCEPLRIPRGSTYGEAVRTIWREHLGREGRPVP